MIVHCIIAAILFSGPTLIVESSQQLFSRAVSMTVRADGSIAVVDQGQNTVSIVMPDNSIAQTIGGAGWGSEAFGLPTDVSTSFLLDLFVSDNSNKRVQRFDKQLHFVQQFDEQSMEGIERCQPIASALSPNGDLYILDDDGKRVVQLNQRSQIVKEFGGFTESNNGIREPKDIAVSADNEIIVLDADRLLFFDRFGNALRSIPLESGRSWKTVSVSGNIVAAVSGDMISLIRMDHSAEETILTSNIIGTTISDPFIDAVIMNESFLLLTSTTIYRCSFGMP